MQNPIISTIFKKEEGGKYSNDALLYQYIMKYPILIREQSTNNNTDSNQNLQGSLWSIIEWLKFTLPEFKLKYANDNISEFIPKVRRRIKGKLDDLVDLELLQSEKIKQEKGDGKTDEYRFTIFGQLLGWIISSIDFDKSSINHTINRREIINKQIFSLLKQIFKTGEYSPTIDILASNFVNNCMQGNLFGNIVNLLKNALNDEEILINDVSDLLRELTTLNFKDQNTKVMLFELWDETIMELEPAIKNIVLYNTKLSIEKKLEDHIKAYQPYEKTWFKFKDDYSEVVVECSCTKCGKYMPVVIEIMVYKKRRFYSTIDPTKLTHGNLLYKCRSLASFMPHILLGSCKACGKENSLRLSFYD